MHFNRASNNWAQYKEAQLVNLQMSLVSNKKLARIQRKKFIPIKKRFFTLIVKGTCSNYLGHALGLTTL